MFCDPRSKVKVTKVKKVKYASGHDNSRLDGWIFTKFGTHMLQTIIKNEFEFGGRTYFPDFSRIFFVQQGSQKWPIYTLLDTITRVCVDEFSQHLVHPCSRPQKRMCLNWWSCILYLSDCFRVFVQQGLHKWLIYRMQFNVFNHLLLVFSF